MKQIRRPLFNRLIGALALSIALVLPLGPAAQANDISDIERSFDRAFGTQSRAPRTYDTPLEAQIASLANAAKGRIGVAAVDLSSGRALDVLGSQAFPMASTSKIAIAATFLEGVEKGRWSLTSEFPLLISIKSKPFSTLRAPVRRGEYLPAIELIELMLTRSSNPATDALLAVVGGPRAVNDWVRRAGITDFRIDRDIATLVRDDGAVDPATTIDQRDSATPLAMVQLLSGLYRGDWLNSGSRAVIFGAMQRCITGKRRIPALLPEAAQVAHKTGSLHNTSSDVGFFKTPDGRAVAIAIYVTGQGGKRAREARIASIARALYDGYLTAPRRYRASASR
ncbi:MAG: class A beta-lactamase-related serine hydrolase [Novosphingobium sp.]|nr:class A beta-lactamase-related serine hydrolase [Novosphingobium sp.]